MTTIHGRAKAFSEKTDLMTKLNGRAEASEYSGKDLETIIDVLANHYSDLDDIWRKYYEKLLAAGPESTKS